MSYTPFQAPLNGGLLGDRETAAIFSPAADLAAMVRFETALAEAQAETGLVPKAAAAAIAGELATFEADTGDLTRGAARDGVVVPSLVEQMRAHVGEPHGRWLHHRTTSQDVIDTAAMLRLREVVALHRARLCEIEKRLEEMVAAYGDLPIHARTRMRRAAPVRLEHRLGAWQAIVAGLEGSVTFEAELQLGGPWGADYRDDPTTPTLLADGLGLRWDGRSWHADRRPMAEFAHWFACVASGLAKIGADVAIMAMDEVDEVRIEGGGRSSAMAHKVNPVKAEALVTLGRFAATLVGGMHQSMIAENERSGSAWMLEWMLMPQLAVASGAATRTALTLIDSMRFERSG